jgi:hypothetical protein
MASMREKYLAGEFNLIPAKPKPMNISQSSSSQKPRSYITGQADQTKDEYVSALSNFGHKLPKVPRGTRITQKQKRQLRNWERAASGRDQQFVATEPVEDWGYQPNIPDSAFSTRAGRFRF